MTTIVNKINAANSAMQTAAGALQTALADVVSDVNAQPQGSYSAPAPLPPRNCLKGPSALSRGGLTYPNPYIEYMYSQTGRQIATFEPGDGVILGCSFTNYISPCFVHRRCVNLGASGASLRHLLNQLALPPVEAMMKQAGFALIDGLLANTIGHEMSSPNNCSESSMLANVHWMLSGLADWLGDVGCGVFIASSKQMTAHQSPYVTNALTATCNAYAEALFAGKPGWTYCDANPTLAPAGELLQQYSELDSNGIPVMGGHLNKAGLVVKYAGPKSFLASLDA